MRARRGGGQERRARLDAHLQQASLLLARFLEGEGGERGDVRLLAQAVSELAAAIEVLAAAADTREPG